MSRRITPVLYQNFKSKKLFQGSLKKMLMVHTDRSIHTSNFLMKGCFLELIPNAMYATESKFKEKNYSTVSKFPETKVTFVMKFSLYRYKRASSDLSIVPSTFSHPTR